MVVPEAVADRVAFWRGVRGMSQSRLFDLLAVIGAGQAGRFWPPHPAGQARRSRFGREARDLGGDLRSIAWLHRRLTLRKVGAPLSASGAVATSASGRDGRYAAAMQHAAACG